MTQIDIRPKSIKILNKILEAIAGLSALSCFAGMVDSVYFHCANLTSNEFMPLATAGIISGLLSIQTLREYWNNETPESLIDELKKKYGR